MLYTKKTFTERCILMINLDMDMPCTDNQFGFVEYTHIHITICTGIGYVMANYY